MATKYVAGASVGTKATARKRLLVNPSRPQLNKQTDKPQQSQQQHGARASTMPTQRATTNTFLCKSHSREAPAFSLSFFLSLFLFLLILEFQWPPFWTDNVCLCRCVSLRRRNPNSTVNGRCQADGSFLDRRLPSAIHFQSLGLGFCNQVKPVAQSGWPSSFQAYQEHQVPSSDSWLDFPMELRQRRSFFTILISFICTDLDVRVVFGFLYRRFLNIDEVDCKLKFSGLLLANISDEGSGKF